MLSVNPALAPGAAPRVLCLGAHCDDIEIGCGGTLLKLARTYPDLSVHWVVLSSNERRAAEAVVCAQDLLREVRHKQIAVERFDDGFFPYQGAAIKRYFESLKDVKPDLVFTHCRHDMHQDHRLTCELTWNTFRNNLILEYEIPKFDGDLRTPNFYVHLDDELCRRKTGAILEHFQTQHGKHWFTEETFRSLMRIRGVESASAGGYAEGFYAPKLVGLA